MLRARITPCLLLRNGGLVKTINFRDEKYIGDPLNAVRVFNEKEVDELIVLDIGATTTESKPDFELIRKIAMECRMPLCYGGGVRTVEDAVKIINSGVEKIAFSSIVYEDIDIIRRLSEIIGSQSIVIVCDYKNVGLLKKPMIFTRNGRRKENIDFYKFIAKMNEYKIGELVLNSIDKDGTMSGYDVTTFRKAREIFEGPMTILGGAGSKEDIRTVITEFGVLGVGVGSFFVFKGRYRAVLISYSR